MASMILPNHRQLKRFGGKSSVAEASSSAFVLTCATQLFNDVFDITASDEVLSADKVYKEAMKRLDARKFVDK